MNKRAQMTRETALWILGIIAVVLILYVFRDVVTEYITNIIGLQAQAQPPK